MSKFRNLFWRLAISGILETFEPEPGFQIKKVTGNFGQAELTHFQKPHTHAGILGSRLGKLGKASGFTFACSGHFYVLPTLLILHLCVSVARSVPRLSPAQLASLPAKWPVQVSPQGRRRAQLFRNENILFLPPSS